MGNQESFLNYVGKILPEDKVKEFFKKQKTKIEYADLFTDFTISLLTLLHDTYLGDDVMSNNDDIRKHFNWCWKKTVDQYKKEKIVFNMEGYHKDYFWYFLFENYYSSEDKELTIVGIKSFFRSVLDITSVIKTSSDLDNHQIIYSCLSEGLKV